MDAAGRRSAWARHLRLDALETESGWKVLEVNDVPGLRGFPDAALDAVAQCVLARL